MGSDEKFLIKCIVNAFSLGLSIIFLYLLIRSINSNFLIMISFNHFNEGILELILFIIIILLSTYSLGITIKEWRTIE